MVEPLVANMTGKWRQQQVDLVYAEHLMGDSDLKHAVCNLLDHHPLGDASQEKCWEPDYAPLDPFPLAGIPPSQYSSDPGLWGWEPVGYLLSGNKARLASFVRAASRGAAVPQAQEECLGVKQNQEPHDPDGL